MLLYEGILWEFTIWVLTCIIKVKTVSFTPSRRITRSPLDSRDQGRDSEGPEPWSPFKFKNLEVVIHLNLFHWRFYGGSTC